MADIYDPASPTVTKEEYASRTTRRSTRSSVQSRKEAATEQTAGGKKVGRRSLTMAKKFGIVPRPKPPVQPAKEESPSPKPILVEPILTKIMQSRVKSTPTIAIGKAIVRASTTSSATSKLTAGKGASDKGKIKFQLRQSPRLKSLVQYSDESSTSDVDDVPTSQSAPARDPDKSTVSDENTALGNTSNANKTGGADSDRELIAEPEKSKHHSRTSKGKKATSSHNRLKENDDVKRTDEARDNVTETSHDNIELDEVDKDIRPAQRDSEIDRYAKTRAASGGDLEINVKSNEMDTEKHIEKSDSIHVADENEENANVKRRSKSETARSQSKERRYPRRRRSQNTCTETDSHDRPDNKSLDHGDNKPPGQSQMDSTRSKYTELHHEDENANRRSSRSRSLNADSDHEDMEDSRGSRYSKRGQEKKSRGYREDSKETSKKERRIKDTSEDIDESGKRLLSKRDTSLKRESKYEESFSKESYRSRHSSERELNDSKDSRRSKRDSAKNEDYETEKEDFLPLRSKWEDEDNLFSPIRESREKLARRESDHEERETRISKRAIKKKESKLEDDAEEPRSSKYDLEKSSRGKADDRETRHSKKKKVPTATLR